MEKKISFDQLPLAVQSLHTKFDKITNLLIYKDQEKVKEENDLLTTDQAASFLNLAKSTVYSKCSKNELPYHKSGKKLFFLKQDLTKYILSGKVKSNSEIQAEADNFLSNPKNNRSHGK